ncbi:major capsid protein [Microviridae sp.]|nr:major capsid protein [Microviridae sp.]
MKRSMFNLSHEHKLNVDMGTLIPVYTDEVLPGDTFIHSASALARVAPLAHPLMHRCEMRMHTFYCPNRVLYDEIEDERGTSNRFKWEDFITGENDTTPKPTFTTGVTEPLLDHMGIPPRAGVVIDSAPIALYNYVWNEFYRDQNLQLKRSLEDSTIANICWQKDYFTVARPDTQQGESTEIPFSAGTIPIISENNHAVVTDRYAPTQNNSPDPDSSVPGFNWRFDNIAADMSNSTAGISIDDLRLSIRLQRFAEARMRWGSRYVDYLRYLGVNPSDGRLDRPEYLGGGKDILNFSEVLTTAEGASTQPGEMFGHGIGLGRQSTFRKMFEEHGWVMTFLSIRPKTVYQNAFPKKFVRHDVMGYWQKELEGLPWQELTEQEVHIDGSPDTIFGYVPKYEEYRHHMSHVSGTFRGGTENDWHMAREFQTPPALNGSFVECTPTDRIYQDANMPNLMMNCIFNIKAARLVGATASMGMGL